jgi:hypothetical protein
MVFQAKLIQRSMSNLTLVQWPREAPYVEYFTQMSFSFWIINFGNKVWGVLNIMGPQFGTIKAIFVWCGTYSHGNKLSHCFSSSNSIIILVFLNKNSNTIHNTNPATGTFSAIDLSMCSPSLFWDFDWKVHDDLCSSDHFPTCLQYNGK